MRVALGRRTPYAGLRGHGGGACDAEGTDLSTYPVMTKWFSPRLLVWAAYRDVAARIFGEGRPAHHAALADPIPSGDDLRRGFVFRYDYATGAGDKPFWVDFVADLGDGFDSTYSIAYLVAADKLYGKGPAKDGIAGIKGLPTGQELPRRPPVLRRRPDLPWPTREAYDQRTFKPYDLARYPRRRRVQTATCRQPAATSSLSRAITTGTTASTPSTTSSAAPAPAGICVRGGVSATFKPASTAAPLQSSCRTIGGSGVPTSS